MLDQLASYKIQIDASLIHFLQSQKQEFSDVNQWTADCIGRLIPFCTSGKSIRGSLILWIAKAYGRQDVLEAMQAAVSIELYHSGLLIHDDVMDADRLRRGKDSLWVQYNSLASAQSGNTSEDYGRYMAMCVGDVAFFLAQKSLQKMTANANFGDIYTLFSSELARVCLAQMQDVSFGSYAQIPEEADIKSLYSGKTGRYTFSLPLIIGAHVSNAPKTDIPVLMHLGELCGLIFQIKDDELNLYGDPKKTGKPVGSDIRNAKKTLYISRLYAKASQTDRDTLKSLLAQVPLPEESCNKIYNLLNSYTIREDMDTYMVHMKQKTEMAVEKLHIAQHHKKDLQSFVAFLYTRDH